jgi:hypothetical protein
MEMNVEKQGELEAGPERQKMTAKIEWDAIDVDFE